VSATLAQAGNPSCMPTVSRGVKNFSALAILCNVWGLETPIDKNTSQMHAMSGTLPIQQLANMRRPVLPLRMWPKLRQSRAVP